MLKNEVDPENSNAKEGEPGTALVYAILRPFDVDKLRAGDGKDVRSKAVRRGGPRRRADCRPHAASAWDAPLAPDSSDSWGRSDT